MGLNATEHAGDESKPAGDQINTAGDVQPILATGRTPRAIDTYLRGPCRAVVGEQVDVWLGFRIGPSIWPGYLRIAFASDLDYNVATLDVHISEFENLKAGLARVAKGYPTGIQFNTPGEICAAHYRRTTAALLITPAQPMTRIEALTMTFEPGLVAEGYFLDVKRALEMLPEVMGTIVDGPARRALRNPSVVEEVSMPEILLDTTDDWQLPNIKVIGRQYQQFDDLTIELPNVPAVLRQQMTCAERLTLDFTDWPAQICIDHRDHEGRRKLELLQFRDNDLPAMRESMQEDFWQMRRFGPVQVDIPVEVRPALMAEIERRLMLAYELHAPKTLAEAQLMLMDVLAPQPSQPTRAKKTVPSPVVTPEQIPEPQMELLPGG